MFFSLSLYAFFLSFGNENFTDDKEKREINVRRKIQAGENDRRDEHDEKEERKSYECECFVRERKS